MNKKYKFPKISFDYLADFAKFKSFNIHHKSNKKLEELFAKTNNSIKFQEEEINDNFKNDIQILSKRILNKLFEEITPLVQQCFSKVLTSINITFFQSNIIRNTENKVENWTFNQLPTNLTHNFGKDHEGEIDIKNILFIDDNSAIIQFSNESQNKSMIYYSNFSNKQQPIFHHVMGLPSSKSNIIIDGKMKLWVIYNNVEKRFNMGKLSGQGRIENGTPVNVYHEKIENNEIIELVSATFIPFSDSILIINQDFELFELKYQSRKLIKVYRKENKDERGVVKSKLLSEDNENYFEVQCTPDGKNIFLRNKRFLDIYDLNWTKIYSFKLEGNYIDFKIIAEKGLIFIIIIHEDNILCYNLVGISSAKILKADLLGTNKNKSNGNPIIDYIYLAFKKFGPHSEFLGCPTSTEFFYLKNQFDKKTNYLSDYFNELSLSNVHLNIVNFEKIEFASFKSIKKDVLKFILTSRVPIHVATIENSTLVPLQDGKNISDQLSENLISQEKSFDLVERVISMIKFGIVEENLKNSPRKIYAISIVGRQSSGKSYGMNRIFGTRFNVASTRCTDGIWISLIKFIEDEEKLYLVMDCEGLFSTRRNDLEEMKLCLTLAAVSDVMILNQDLSFSRYLNSLFSNFSKSIGRLKGKNLFRGYLLMLIRDVGTNEFQGAYIELQSNISQVINNEKPGSNFLDALFKGHLVSQCLNYFEKPIFNKEINLLRKTFINSNKVRWASGIDFLDSFKIILAQVFMDDDTYLDAHKLKITCEHVFRECLEMFFKGGEKFEEFAYVGNVKIIEENGIMIYQKAICLDSSYEEISEDKGEEKDVSELINRFTDCNPTYKLEIHNIWIKALNSFINELLDQRLNFILNYFEKNTPKDEEFKDEINSYLFKLKYKCENFILKIKNCEKNCQKCSRVCQEKLNHITNCKCGTEHICLEICDSSLECSENKYKCVLLYGHEGPHKCNEGNHRCGQACEVIGCPFTCNVEKMHTDPVKHDCKNSHPCNKPCIDEKCSRTCQFDRTVPHENHICGERKCIHKCFLCPQICGIEDHLHDLNIKADQEHRLKFFLIDEEHLINYNICGNEHECEDICTNKGVCQVGYNIIEKIWKNDFGEFNYPYFEPMESKIKCKVLIPKFMRMHEDVHSCKIKNHRCNHQCPECKSFCNENIDHEGLHKTNTHRNKEHNVFVSSKDVAKLNITAEGKTRNYKIGESCQPENCTQSCDRKGRAHFHLRRCKGPEECDAKINPYVRHSKVSYYPFIDIVFDEWLCSNFWNSMNWDVPCPSKKSENDYCNFVCNHSSHKDTLNFCLKHAWHTDKHEFECVHTGFSSLIDLVFCCDSTGSMSSYIEKSKLTVKNIITKVQKSYSKDVLFGFVAYRDHPPQDTTYVTSVQSLCNESTILSFIGKLSASGGGDGPEAVLDGLYDSMHKMSWRKDSVKYLIHIADAPPHGKIYTDGSGDGFPSGCPCGITIENLAKALKENNIRYKLLKIGSYPNKMATIFKSHIEDFEEGDLDSAVQLENKVSDIIIRDIKVEEFDFNTDV